MNELKQLLTEAIKSLESKPLFVFNPRPIHWYQWINYFWWREAKKNCRVLSKLADHWYRSHRPL